MFEKTATQSRPDDIEFSQHFDSLQLRQDINGMDLSQFLADESGLYINDYGPGLLSSPSFRGGAAEQTVLVWNGAKLNSPTLGTTDLSVIAIDQFEEVSVFASSASDVYTSGGIGGGIWLGDKADYANSGISLSINTGSFGLYAQSLKSNWAFKIGKQPAALNAQVSHRNAANDYTYIDNASEPFEEDRRRHSSFNNLNAQLSFASFFGDKLEYNVHYWRSQAYREVPNTIKLRIPSEAIQTDTADRFQVLLKYQASKRWSLHYMAFYEVNSNYYQDDRIDLKSHNEFRSLQQTLEAKHTVNSWLSFNAILNQNAFSAVSGNYDGRKGQTQESLMLGADANWKSLLFQPTLKAQHAEGEVYILPNLSAGMELLSKQRLVLKANYAENVRLPTLNQLYWTPGGNPDLRPEKGRTMEVGISSYWEAKQTRFTGNVSYFRGRFEDWIRWLPVGATFRPRNLLTVNQQGVDGRLDWTAKTAWGSVHSSVGAVWSQVIDVSNADSDPQMIYVPELQGRASAGITWKWLSIRYTHSYMGERYITSDNSRYMPAFHVGRAVLSTKVLSRDRLAITTTAGVDNAWNENYQVIAWRPMPTRNYFVNLNFQFLR